MTIVQFTRFKTEKPEEMTPVIKQAKKISRGTSPEGWPAPR
ncbi:hypothetical protein [Bradyrhizobium sp. USDA 4469]